MDRAPIRSFGSQTMMVDLGDPLDFRDVSLPLKSDVAGRGERTIPGNGFSRCQMLPTATTSFVPVRTKKSVEDGHQPIRDTDSK